MTLDTFFRLLGIFLLLFWRAYWWIEEQKADTEKQKTRTATVFEKIKHIGVIGAGVVLVLQLVGLDILPIPNASFSFQFVGFLLFLSGFIIGVTARKELSSNWVNGHEYQIKKDQVLITSGIYRFVRHPIYTGIFLLFLGAELIANSYLFLATIVILIGVYQQSKREEKILLQHFGKKYEEYMKRSNMLIPFVY